MLDWAPIAMQALVSNEILRALRCHAFCPGSKERREGAPAAGASAAPSAASAPSARAAGTANSASVSPSALQQVRQCLYMLPPDAASHLDVTLKFIATTAPRTSVVECESESDRKLPYRSLFDKLMLTPLADAPRKESSEQFGIGNLGFEYCPVNDAFFATMTRGATFVMSGSSSGTAVSEQDARSKTRTSAEDKETRSGAQTQTEAGKRERCDARAAPYWAILCLESPQLSQSPQSPQSPQARAHSDVHNWVQSGRSRNGDVSMELPSGGEGDQQQHQLGRGYVTRFGDDGLPREREPDVEGAEDRFFEQVVRVTLYHPKGCPWWAMREQIKDEIRHALFCAADEVNRRLLLEQLDEVRMRSE